MSVTQDRIGVGNVQPDFILEFRTWNGAAYVWTDYTARLVEFKGVGAQVEERAYPNAFRMTLGDIIVDNSDGMFKDLDVLDGLLFNSAEPYGKSIYKRMVRVRDAAGGSVIATGLVRDVVLDYNTPVATIKVISLDARAADQKVDGDKAERHPLGGTSQTSPAYWTTSVPTANGEVAMYRWREEESQGQVLYGWFKNRHYSRIVERTAWALDDLATDINKTYRINTSPAREIVTTRGVPANAPNTGGIISLVWNPARNVLVCLGGDGVNGEKIYDYDPLTDTYTLRNTLSANRRIVRAWYTTTTDAAGKNKRIVLLQYNISGYLVSALRVITAYVTVLDATGTGAYTLLANEVSLGADFFPGTHFLREGGASGANNYIGQWLENDLITTVSKGENAFHPFRQLLHCVNTSGPPLLQHQTSNPNKLSVFAFGLTANNTVFSAETRDNGYFAAKNSNDITAMGARHSYGQFPAATINVKLAGGRLCFFVWDATNNYRMAIFNLSDYTGPTYVTLSRSSTDQPYTIFAHQATDDSWRDKIWMAQMEWVDVGSNRSLSRVYEYDIDVGTWTEITWHTGASGDDQYWTIMEMISVHNGSGSPYAIMFNRKTRKWRFNRGLKNDWTNTSNLFVTMYARSETDNRLEGMLERQKSGFPDTPGDVFFVEAGSNMLWAEVSGVMKHMNTSPNPPATGVSGDPINGDRGLGAFMVWTGYNYPDSGTPNGIIFGMSANDYPFAGDDRPSGEYALWQFANFDTGFVPLLDFSGLSFWELRTLLAESLGFVHYYAPDGTLIFKPRATSGALDFTFSETNRNLKRAQIDSRGFEAIMNDVTVFPYKIVVEQRTTEIEKGYNELSKDGMLTDVIVSAAPRYDIHDDPEGVLGESAQWQLLFVSDTTYDLYKIQGFAADGTTPKAAAQSINAELRAPKNGLYLTILPSHFSGSFVVNDSFIFWVLEPQEKLEKGGDPDRVRVIDLTSIDKYRRIQKEFDNRFIRKQISADYANGILAWRKERHDVVKISAAFDPDYLPLKRCTIQDTGLGLDGITFQIMGVRHDSKNFNSELTLVRV